METIYFNNNMNDSHAFSFIFSFLCNSIVTAITIYTLTVISVPIADVNMFLHIMPTLADSDGDGHGFLLKENSGTIPYSL
jgi:hypothetical protein